MPDFKTYRVVVEIMDKLGEVIRGRQQIVRMEIAASEAYAIKAASRAALAGSFYTGSKVTRATAVAQ